MIMATAIGEESFDDANGNGYYDQGETFSNLGEPYRDDNEDGAYEVGEYFLDFNKNGVRDPGDGIFKGITCAGTTCTTTTLAISASHLMIMSTSAALATFVSASGAAVSGNAATGLTITHGTSAVITVNVTDANGNAMAAGTKVAYSADASAGTVTQTPSPFVIGCDEGTNGVNVAATLAAASAAGGGNITIQVTSPNGTNSVFTIGVTVN